MVGKVLGKSGYFGFDTQTEEYVDMAGIIDPTKLVRIALQDAASNASLLEITTEAMVAERPKKEYAPVMPPGGGMGGMGGVDY